MKLKFLLTFLAIFFTIPQIVLAEEQELNFIDFKSNHPHYQTVKTMVNKGYISGSIDGRFKAHENISRKQAAALIARLNNLPKPSQSKAIPKDLSTKHPNFSIIMQLYNLDLLEVDAKGKINPNQDLTRGEMAKIIAVAFNFKGENDYYTDLSPEIAPYVKALKANFITLHYRNTKETTFKENDPLTRIEYVLAINSALYMTGALYEGPTDEKVYYRLLEQEEESRLFLPKTEGNLTRVELMRKLEKEFAKYSYANCFNGSGGISLYSVSKAEIEEHIRRFAQRVNVTEEILTKQIIEAYLNGIVVTNEGYSDKTYAFYVNPLNSLLYSGQGSDNCPKE